MWASPAVLLAATVIGVEAIGSRPVFTSPLGPVVDLGYAAYVGNSTSPGGQPNSTVTFYGGIPYVQPPLGSLRFRAPKDLDEAYNPNRTMVDARSWGPTCVQQPAKEGVGVEDCLNLNIWKPTSAKAGAKLPVVAYIHGGGFFFGSSPQFPMYDWVAQDQNVVAVSMNYRLHLFGFLDGTAVRADGTPNAGLLDQRAALLWIKRHISKFGGDPENVTIAGESAGGASVVLQATAWAGKSPVPFKRAIAQSIGLYPLPLDSEIEGIFNNVTTAAGCPSSGSEAMECLRAAPLSTLIKSINNVRTNFLAPTIDGPNGFLPDLPSRLIAQGKFRRGIDLVAGHMTNDGRNFAGNPKNVKTDADIVTAILNRYRHMTNATLEKVLKLYPTANASGSPFVDNYDRAWTIMQDTIFGCMDQHWANATRALGRKSVYAFRFNVPNPVTLAVNPWQGVMHASDVYHLFNGATGTTPSFAPFNITQAPVAQEIMQYWTSFARSSDPSKFKRSYSPIWPSYTGNRRIVMSEDVGGSGKKTASFVETIPTYEQERCSFWMSLNETRV
ncbi:carboxyesterase-postia placenta Mad-698-R-like protein [Rhizoctonia solani AG-3 Rhs1AP]|uniref:Carboxylic ester hydrolase n=1 Tax=Rhizoctonia solani AG-3 Rhs1AP TaxID=1086054 RepID=A0A0A1UJH5_9AGAM|nr:carboxyesterase-postia placenta Mad-698-R-like protein [Rhizoctonia solani AG-3 Rhs1AP]